MKQNELIAKHYYSSGNYVVTTQRKYYECFDVHDEPSNYTVLRIFEKFERTGRVLDEEKYAVDDHQ